MAFNSITSGLVLITISHSQWHNNSPRTGMSVPAITLL